MDGGEEIHDGGGGGAPHAKVDDGDIVGRGVGHRLILAVNGDVVPLREEIHIAVEVGQENVTSETVQGDARVARQPVFDNFSASLHGEF